MLQYATITIYVKCQMECQNAHRVVEFKVATICPPFALILLALKNPTVGMVKTRSRYQLINYDIFFAKTGRKNKHQNSTQNHPACGNLKKRTRKWCRALPGLPATLDLTRFWWSQRSQEALRCCSTLTDTQNIGRWIIQMMVLHAKTLYKDSYTCKL